MMKNKFEAIKYLMKPFFFWVPSYLREKVMYPYATYFTLPLIIDKPKNLILELTNICNLKCKICNRPSQESPVGSMQLSLATELIKRAYDCGIDQVAFHTVGEPLVYPYLKEVLTFAKKLGYPIMISTNANLLTKENSDMLLDVGIDRLRISLEGTDEKYNEVREGGDFNKVIKNLEYFHKKRHGHPNIRLDLTYVITRDTVECIKSFLEKYSYLFDEIIFTPLINQGNMQNDYVKNRSIILFKNNRYPCFNLWTTMYVTFNGDVSVCCVDYNHKLIIGNVHDSSLLDLWNSDAYKQYRRLNREGKVNKIKYCSNCTVPVLGSNFYMTKIADKVRKDYGLSINILGRY
ncbi:MAG: radical SAM/SPASM domain-containing protein [Candidatus Omnitrophica bacterium]|nr:radical SAM/SPASM domain-containing protein [Candidatus Omnitrophota bacterium]